MSVGADLAKGLALSRSVARPAFVPQSQIEDQRSGLDKVLDFLNRGTSASASAFDEILFEQTPEPVQEFLNGLMGKGKVQSFGELSRRAGWNPTTREGKAAQFLFSLGLDVGLAPDTYLTFGAAPAGKVLGKSARLLKAGKTATEIGKDFGKQAGIGAKILKRAEALKDPRVDEVVSKLLKGEEITKAEEAVVGARTIAGMQTLGLFGPSNVITPIPREAHIKFFESTEKLGKLLDEAPVISPVIHGFGKAFNKFYEIKKKVPDYFHLRKARDQKVQATGAQAMERAIRSIAKLANKEERDIISFLVEEGPEAGVVTNSFYKDVTKVIDQTPELWADLGFKPGQTLNETEAVDLVNHFTNEVNQWISEFGTDGIFDVRRTKSEMDRLQDAIRLENEKGALLRQQLDETKKARKAGVPDSKQVSGDDAAILQQQIKASDRALSEFEKALRQQQTKLMSDMGPVVDEVDKFDLGRGHFGQVKGRWDIVKFQDHVLKLPVDLTPTSFQSLIAEAKVYEALSGIPGVGKARMVFKDLPLDEHFVNKTADVMFSPKAPGAPSMLEDLEGAGHVLTNAAGQKVIRIPHLVKKMVDIDKEATAAFHATGGNPKWNLPTKSIRSFEKMLSRSSRQGVALNDLVQENLVIDRKGQVHMLDPGFGHQVDKTLEGRQSAWRRNLLQFTHHVINNTRFTSKDAQAAVRHLTDRIHEGVLGKGPINDADVEVMVRALKSVGMPVRYLSEKGATEPLVEGFVKLKGDTKTGKVIQRELVEERKLLIDDLSPAGREAYDNVMMWKREMTEKLLASGLLTEDWITSFEAKFGVKHLRHWRTQEGLVKRFQRAVSQSIAKGAKPGTLKARKVEGSLREIEERLGAGFFETDIAKVMFMSEVETASAIENWNLLRKVRDNTLWTKPAVETRRVVKRGGKTRTVKGWAADDGYELVSHPLFNDGRKAWMVKKEIAEDVKGLITKSREDVGANVMKKWYDPAHNWLRAYTLFMFPSYHIRNIAGAVWNNFLADVDPRMHFKAHSVIFGGKDLKTWAKEFQAGKPFEIDGIRSPRPNQKLGFKIDGKEVTNQKILDEMNEHGVLGRGQMGPFGELERGITDELGKITPDATPGGLVKGLAPLPPVPTMGLDGGLRLHNTAQDNMFVQFGARVGTQIENVVRAAHYIDKRKAGLSAYDAAMSVKKFQFDYSELSPFEKDWLKRAFFFYTWTRKNVPLQAKMFLLRPGKFGVAAKGVQEVESSQGGPEPDAGLVPEWLHKQFGVRIGYDKKNGTYEYFMLGSWLPAADLNRVFNPGEELMNMLSPIPKQVLEQAFNKSLFFDSSLEEFPGERKEFLSPEAGKLLEGIPGADAISQLAFGAPISEGVSLRGRLNNALRQFRVVNEARRVNEALARGGPELALVNSLIGKSYEFDPQRARRGKDYETKMQIAHLKSQLSKARRRGKASEARRLLAEIRALEKELIR